MVTVEYRLLEIQAEIPHVGEGGNTLRKEPKRTLIVNQILKGGNDNKIDIPEFISKDSQAIERHFELLKDYMTLPHNTKWFRGLAKMSNNNVAPKHFTEENSVFLDRKKVELYTFYNPQSDITHYYLLPKKD